MNGWQRSTIYLWAIWLAYVLLQLLPYYLPGKVPDESWFLAEAQSVAVYIRSHGLWYSFWHQENTLGYGAFYWYIYGSLTIVFPQSAFWVMRSLALIASSLIPALIIIAGRRQRSVYT